MPEKTSPIFALPYPNSTGKVNLGATDFAELATTLDTLLGEKFLRVKTSAVEITAKAGELVEMTAAGTVNLPKAAAANTIVGVFAQKGEVTVKTTSAEKIVGGALPEAGTSITLGTGQYALFDYDGTRYLVVGGVPKEYIGDTQVVKGRALVETENSYVPQVEHTANPGGYEEEISATRPAYAIVEVPTGAVEIFVGSGVFVTIGNVSGVGSLGFPVPPKLKVRVSAATSVKFFLTHLIQ